MCNVWAASMTQSNQYNPFVVSRLFAGVFGAVPSILGASTITDLFFLHERGRTFLTFSLSFLLGTVAGPTFGGFIVEHVDWPVEFWWTVGLQCLALVLIFLFLEETGFDRDGGSAYPTKPKSFIQDRVATFLLGTNVVPATSRSEIVSHHRLPSSLINVLTHDASFIVRQLLFRLVCLRSLFWWAPSSFSRSVGLS